MSACISSHGEFSEHEMDETGFACLHCGFDDIEAMCARIAQLEAAAEERSGWRPPAQVIETVEQLAEVRFLTIVREVVRSSPSGANYGAVWERRSSGWQCIAGSVAPRSEPKLPAELLWSPTEKAGQ